MKKTICAVIHDQIICATQKLFPGLVKRALPTQLPYEVTALKCIFAYNQYGGYCVPESSKHRYAAQKILNHDVHEPDTLTFMRTHCLNGDVVHAGTYFGDFLPALSTAVAPNATIWAFEPNMENYRCAKITLELNNISNIVLTNAGLGEKQEVLSIITTDESGRALGGASRIITNTSNETTSKETVQIVTIDDIVKPDRYVSIIQLDVEGHEQAALAGALKTIQRCLPIIILEVLEDSTLLESDWFAKNILSFGYRKTGSVHSNAVFSCSKRV